MRYLVVIICLLLKSIEGFIHPITVRGKSFVDSVTQEQFYIKGVDYQPGGSSGVTDDKDPLSDPKECARDIIMLQDLGINTIRIYSINTDLNHDVCMSMLAAAGIYLVLDVNSPLPNHHLNRNEPWKTYNDQYLKNIFKVVEQFSYYNNTLGFFAGNEIVNDNISAKNSPTYVKALIRDLKMYIEYNSPRQIPVGYSAADDLNYRVPFSKYLECIDDNTSHSVDFYGVNSYQWCGEQTFYTSGYNILADDYSSFSRPVFLSEYGCNEVLPRMFDEVQTLYSTNMNKIFSGGLVYEYSQEPNNYGLVEILENGDIKVLPDFIALKSQFESLTPINNDQFIQNTLGNLKGSQKASLPKCKKSYSNIDISKVVPKIAKPLIDSGIDIERGKYVELQEDDLVSSYNILNYKGEPYAVADTMEIIFDHMSGEDIIRTNKNDAKHKCKYNVKPYLKTDFIFKMINSNDIIKQKILTNLASGSSLSIHNFLSKLLVYLIVLEFTLWL